MPHPSYPTSTRKPINDWLELSTLKEEVDQDKLGAAVQSVSIALGAEEVRFATVCVVFDLEATDIEAGTRALYVFTDERLAIVYLEDLSEEGDASQDRVSISPLRYSNLGVQLHWDSSWTDKRIEFVSFTCMKPFTTEAHTFRLSMPPRRRPEDEVTMQEEDAESVRRVWAVMDFLRSKVVAK